MDIDDAIQLLEGLIKFIDEYRETGFSDFMDEAKEMARKMGIEPVFREKCIIRRKKQFDENESEEMRKSSKESFRVDYFLHIVDQARSSLQTRFEQFKQYEEIFGFLLNWERLKREPSSSFLKSCMKLEKYLEFNRHSHINRDDLCSELLCLKSYLLREATRAIEMLQYLKIGGCFPNAYVAYKILLTILVTVATTERSFSKLKLIKTYLRSTMSQERLNGLVMLSIEKEMIEQLDDTSLIYSTFASKNVRRVVFK